MVLSLFYIVEAWLELLILLPPTPGAEVIHVCHCAWFAGIHCELTFIKIQRLLLCRWMNYSSVVKATMPPLNLWVLCCFFFCNYIVSHPQWWVTLQHIRTHAHTHLPFCAFFITPSSVVLSCPKPLSLVPFLHKQLPPDSCAFSYPFFDIIVKEQLLIIICVSLVSGL